MASFAAVAAAADRREVSSATPSASVSSLVDDDYHGQRRAAEARGARAGMSVSAAAVVAREARKSKFNEVTHKVPCLACSKYFSSYSALEAHLTAKHGGVNSKDAKHSFPPSSGKGGPPLPPSKKKYHESITLTQFLQAKPKRKAGHSKAVGRGGSGQHGLQEDRRSVKGKNKLLVLNTNSALASGDRFVVRRSKERVTGKKQKVSRVKMGVLLSRSSALVEGAERRSECIRSQLESKTRELQDLREGQPQVHGAAGESKSADDETAAREESRAVASLENLQASLRECESTLQIARIQYGDVVAEVRGGPSLEDGGGKEGVSGEGMGAPCHGPVMCDICNVECPNQRAYEQHCVGKLHRAKQASNLKTSMGKNALSSPKRECVGPLDEAFRDLVLRDLEVMEGRSEGGGEVAGHEPGSLSPPCFQGSISKDLNTCVSRLVERLLFLQRRAYRENPVKNKSRKRVVFGLNEVKKSIRTKCKALIVVPNIELGAPDLVETTRDVLRQCLAKKVAVVFALTRSRLGGLVKRGVRMSMCSVLDTSGAEGEFKRMLELSSALADVGVGGFVGGEGDGDGDGDDNGDGNGNVEGEGGQADSEGKLRASAPPFFM